MGSVGLSLARAARASSKMGTTVWSRYCRVGRPLSGCGCRRDRLPAGDAAGDAAAAAAGIAAEAPEERPRMEAAAPSDGAAAAAGPNGLGLDSLSAKTP